MIDPHPAARWLAWPIVAQIGRDSKSFDGAYAPPVNAEVAHVGPRRRPTSERTAHANGARERRTRTAHANGASERRKRTA
jgi:hypothetical protein